MAYSVCERRRGALCILATALADMAKQLAERERELRAANHHLEEIALLDGLSGLADIANRLERVPGIAVVRLDERDIVRHPLVGDMLTVL